MRIAIINLTAGGMSGGYRKYLQKVLPRMAKSDDVEEILYTTPLSIDIQSWFSFSPKVNFVTSKPFNMVYYSPEYGLKKTLERFSPDVIFIPVERYFKFDRIPVENMIQNMEPFADNLIENSVYNKRRLNIQRIIAKRAVEKSDRVVVILKYVKEFLMYNWNIPDEKIGLISHGIELPMNREIQLSQNMPKDWEENLYLLQYL